MAANVPILSVSKRIDEISVKADRILCILMGDVEHPLEPGLVEQVRGLRTRMDNLESTVNNFIGRAATKADLTQQEEKEQAEKKHTLWAWVQRNPTLALALALVLMALGPDAIITKILQVLTQLFTH